MPKRHAPYTNRCWPHLRLAILRRDGWLCQIRRDGCRITADCVDHIVEWEPDPTIGGAWFDPANLRAACSHCNIGRKRRQGKNRTLEHAPSRNW